MQSHFEINVSENGRHLFATAPRSFTNMTDAGYTAVLAVADRLAVAFPAATVTVTRWDGVGTSMATIGPVPTDR